MTGADAAGWRPTAPRRHYAADGDPLGHPLGARQVAHPSPLCPNLRFLEVEGQHDAVSQIDELLPFAHVKLKVLDRAAAGEHRLCRLFREVNKIAIATHAGERRLATNAQHRPDDLDRDSE